MTQATVVALSGGKDSTAMSMRMAEKWTDEGRKAEREGRMEDALGYYGKALFFSSNTGLIKPKCCLTKRIERDVKPLNNGKVQDGCFGMQSRMDGLTAHATPRRP